jgi:putative resolvase
VGVNLTERARLQGLHPQTAYRWFGEDRLPVPAVRVIARTVLIGPDADLAPAVPGGSACLRGCHLMPWRLTWTGRSKVARLLADPAAVMVVEHRDRLGRLTTEILGAALAAYGQRPPRNRAQKALRRAARHLGPSHPEAAA